MGAMTNAMTELPGQETLVACWRALATLSPGAQVTQTADAEIARFPAWAPLNNAIVLDRGADLDANAAAAATASADRYQRVGVDTWALWIPSAATDFAAPDRVAAIAGLQRDTTTLVMQTDLVPMERRHEGIVPTSIALVARVGVEPMTASDLDAPDEVPGLTGWVLVYDGVVVAGAWAFVHERDCGIYAVETVTEWRRRGFASALMHHIFTDARGRGAETATLQSTPMGRRLYESLGFEAVGRYEEWIPAEVSA